MRSIARFSAVLSTGILIVAAAGCATAAPGGSLDPVLHPEWKHEMEAGLVAWQMGRPDAAASHYRQALHLARHEALPPEELAFSSYRLGDAIRVAPAAARGEDARSLLEEARRHFETAYGTEHPVLIPVWVRLAELRARAADADAAAAARAAADRIAVRFFPESHFLRERYGAARPAAMMHPLEMLFLVAEWENGSARVTGAEASR